jgi:hypothetical protein
VAHRSKGIDEPTGPIPDPTHPPIETGKQAVTYQPSQYSVASTSSSRSSLVFVLAKVEVCDLAAGHQAEVGNLPDDGQVPNGQVLSEHS